MTFKIHKPVPINIEQTYCDSFNILLNYGQLTDTWHNIYKHCKVCATAGYVLSSYLKMSADDVNLITNALILHDWYKRFEVEAAWENGVKGYNASIDDSKRLLRNYGIGEKLIDLAHCVGHSALDEVKRTNDVKKKLVHLIDSMVSGEELVGYEKRISSLESQVKYKELNESGRGLHGGKTYFEVQREISERFYNRIAQAFGLSNSELLDSIMEDVAIVNKNQKAVRYEVTEKTLPISRLKM